MYLDSVPALRMIHPSSQFANGAFLSVDWVSMICDNISIRQLMFLLKLDNYTRVSMEKGTSRWHPGCDAFAFRFNGVEFSVNKTVVACYGLDNDKDDIFDFKFDSVRVNFSGIGLKFLRSEYEQYGLWADRYLLYFFTMPDAPKGHFTRLDFALDFVNDFSNVMRNIVRHLEFGGVNDKGNPCPGGFYSGGAGRPYKPKIDYSPDDGGCTIYIGSKASDRFMRVYNKLVESKETVKVGNEKIQSWKPGAAPDFPGIDANSIQTWVRFELVVRNAKAVELTPLDADSLCVLDHPSWFVKEIQKRFIPLSSSRAADWWTAFWKPFEEENKVQILYNREYLKSGAPATVRAVNYTATVAAINGLATDMLVSTEECPYFMKMWNQRLLLWAQLDTKGDAYKSWIKLKQIFISDGLIIDDLHLVWDDKYGCWQFPSVPLLMKEHCVNKFQKQLGSRFGWTWEPEAV